MIGLVVTGHGLFAEGMHSSANMIAGENELVKYVCFKEGMNTEQLSENLIAAYNELGACDGIIVLSGTNLPMIITAATMASFSDDAEAMAEELLFEGKDNVVRFAMTEREEVEEDEDGI